MMKHHHDSHVEDIKVLSNLLVDIVSDAIFRVEEHDGAEVFIVRKKLGERVHTLVRDIDRRVAELAVGAGR